MSHHGLVLINKSTGMSSHDVVNRLRRILGTRDVGHAGTLDPLATGLMVCLVGEATKISDYVLNEDKAYRVKVKLGVRTDSLDMTGEILELKDVNVSPKEISEVAQSLQGEFDWPVPQFSAVKVAGKKLYESAHKNEAPIKDLPVRRMKFWGVDVGEVTHNTLAAHLHCSKGSYIRTWASELGERLHVGGAVEELERTVSSPYLLKDAVTVEELDALFKSQGLVGQKCFVPLSYTLQGWKTLTVKGKDETLLLNGQVSHDLDRRLILEQKAATREQRVIGIKILSAATGQLIAILEARPNYGLKIRRVFRY